MNVKTVATHNGKFHADDVFAVAALELLNGGELAVIRTRDPEKIKSADCVVDVGMIYDVALGRFDHHQVGGAGSRENGIPYASFGLVWKAYGMEICGNEEVMERIDKKLVMAIDADDNGVSLCEPKFEEVKPFEIDEAVSLFVPTWKEGNAYDEQFPKAVSWAKEVLKRLIQKESHRLEAKKIVKDAYDKSLDKRIVILDGYYPIDHLSDYPEPLYVICPSEGNWRVMAVRSGSVGFDVRKPFPESWAGKRDKDLADISGVPDAIFCHNGRFLAVAGSKGGALKLAEIALTT